MGKLDGKVAAITGAGGGIGRALAKACPKAVVWATAGASWLRRCDVSGGSAAYFPHNQRDAR